VLAYNYFQGITEDEAEELDETEAAKAEEAAS
jgi:hypothetical protein